MSEPEQPKRRPKRRKKGDGDERVNLWVSGDVYQALRDKIHDDNTTITQVVDEALRKLLNVPPPPESGQKGGACFA